MSILARLYTLQQLEFNEIRDLSTTHSKDEIRNQIPPHILARFDHFVGRGKKAVSLIRNNVCTGCHMQLPIGMMNTLLQSESKGLHLCESCGRYLYLPMPVEPPKASEPQLGPVKTETVSKPTPKSRQPKIASEVEL